MSFLGLGMPLVQQGSGSTIDPIAALNPYARFRADFGFTPSSWSDMGSQGKSAVQATGAKQPSLTSSWKNGKPGVLFSGVSQLMATPNWSAALATATIFVVCDLTALGTTAQTFFSGIISTARNQTWWANSTTGSLSMFAGATLNSTTVTPWVVGAHHILECNFNGAASTAKIDGVQVLSGNAGTQALAALTIGNDYSGASGAPCHIGEIIPFPLLSSTDATTVRNALKSYWATP